jgi:hypothetical protein
MEICQSAYDRTFVLQSIDTSNLTSNSLIRLDEMFLVHADPKSRSPVVRQLTGDHESLAANRIRFAKENILLKLKSGKEIELVPEEFVKTSDGSFDLQFIGESGTIDKLPLNDLTSESNPRFARQ